MAENKDLEEKIETSGECNEGAVNEPIEESKSIGDIEKKKIVSIVKYAAVAGAGLIMGALMFAPTAETTEKANKYDAVVLELTDKTEKLSSTNMVVKLLNKEKKDLQEKVEEAAPWFELSEKQREEQIVSQAKKDNAKYLTLIDSGKSYYSMNKKERVIIDEWIESKYDDSATQLQELYKEKHNKLKKDRESSLEKIEKDKEKTKKEALKKAEAEKYKTGLTWEQIAREGEIGVYGQFEGKVIQVMKGDGFVQCRVATKGNYDNVMLIEVNEPGQTILEGDYIKFKGMSMGAIEYQTVLGAQASIPGMLVTEYTLK